MVTLKDRWQIFIQGHKICNIKSTLTLTLKLTLIHAVHTCVPHYLRGVHCQLLADLAHFCMHEDNMCLWILEEGEDCGWGYLWVGLLEGGLLVGGAAGGRATCGRDYLWVGLLEGGPLVGGPAGGRATCGLVYLWEGLLVGGPAGGRTTCGWACRREGYLWVGLQEGGLHVGGTTCGRDYLWVGLLEGGLQEGGAY